MWKHCKNTHTHTHRHAHSMMWCHPFREWIVLKFVLVSLAVLLWSTQTVVHTDLTTVFVAHCGLCLLLLSVSCENSCVTIQSSLSKSAQKDKVQRQNVPSDKKTGTKKQQKHVDIDKFHLYFNFSCNVQRIQPHQVRPPLVSVDRTCVRAQCCSSLCEAGQERCWEDWDSQSKGECSGTKQMCFTRDPTTNLTLVRSDFWKWSHRFFSSTADVLGEWMRSWFLLNK